MAAARAAARRQAILSSRSDRLAKLTSSARGDDPGGVFAHDDPPVPSLGSGLGNSVKESIPSSKSTETPRTPPRAADDASAPAPEWDPDQQHELLRALMKDAGPRIPGSQADKAADPSTSPPDDPFAKLLGSLTGEDTSATVEMTPPRPRTLISKLIPVLHMLCMLALLVWFIGWKEPEASTASMLTAVKPGSNGEDASGGKYVGWRRWARLAVEPPTLALAVPPMPAFFWAFITLELVLHSTRLFSQVDNYQPPMLVELVLPYLPSPFPQYILTSLKYLRMLGMVLDDLAILVFGIGLIIFVSNWAT